MTLHPRIYIIRIFLITLALSLIAHLLLIFYVPPLEELSFLSMSGQANTPTKPLQITIQGNMQGERSTTQAGQQQEFAEQLGLDKEKWANLLQKLKDNTGLASAYKQSNKDVSKKFNVKKSYINRPRHHEDIVIKDVFPTIHNIEKPFSEILNAAPKALKKHNQRNKIIKAYRDWNLHKRRDATLFVSLNSKTDDNNNEPVPLIFPKEKRQIYFDESLSLPKGLQLSNFISKYFSYDPDKGDLAIATRELYYDNLQRLAYSFSTDPSYLYLDYFLENLNKEDFLKNALYQASKLDQTKTQTELLFALEDIYHIQQRAWRYYFEYDKLYKSIPEEKRQYLRIETLRRVVAGYKKVLASKNIKDYKTIETLYRKKRREIFDYIIAHTPKAYRQSDALFEKAAMDWQQGFADNNANLKIKAVKQWLSIPLETASPTETESTEAENTDHLTQLSLKKLSPELSRLLSNNPQQHLHAQNNIQSIVNNRHASRITKKRLREETLLWK